jgi:hypothetical protein
MDAEARKAAFAEAKAESLEALERTASIKVEYRDHDDDGMLSRWSRTMPPKPAPPTVEEVEAIVADRVSAAISEHNDVWREVIAQALASERQRHRGVVEQLDLRLSALLSEVTKRQTVEAEPRDGIIDLPMLPRSARRA